MVNDAAVLVTGSTSGIGTAVCQRFAAEGYHVFAHARSDQRGSEVVDGLRAAGGSAQLLLADLANDEAPARLIELISASPYRLVAVVNNAGGVLENAFQPGQVEEPLASYQLNVFAAYSLSVLAADAMGEGSIVNVSSVHAHAPWGARIPHYSASKAALSHLTKMLAIKLAPRVRVNAVSPGRTMTSAWGQITAEESAALADDQLIRRWIEPKEVADAVWFLTINGACVGTDLVIDGGMSLSAVLANT